MQQVVLLQIATYEPSTRGRRSLVSLSLHFLEG